MRINTNVASMTAMESSTQVNKQLSSSLEKLSSGLRINKAADDASGMAIADKLRTQASSLGQSISNANSGNALVQIADKAMAEQSNILDIVKQKLIQAATSTTSEEGREAIRKDITKLLGQLDNIASQTNYNGINLLDTKGKSFTFQVGEFANNSISAVTAYAANTSGLGVVDDATGATKTFTITDSAASGQTLTLGSYSVTLNSTTGASDTAALTALANVINGTDATATPPTENTNVSTNGFTASVDNGTLVLTSSVLGADADQATFDAAVASLDLVQSNITRTAVSAITATVTDAALSATNGVTEFTLPTDADPMLKSGDSIAVAFEVDNVAGTSVKTLNVTYDVTADMTTDEIGAALAQAIQDQIDTYSGTIGNASITVSYSASTNKITLTGGQTTATDLTAANNTLTFTRATESNAAEVDAVGEGNSLVSVKNVTELTTDLANSFMSVIDQALTEINTIRSDFGSTQNQLDSFIRNAMTTQTNIKAAESVIRDVDYAAESANFNKQNIIAQAGTFALSQANNVQQNILKLLQ